MKKNKLIYAFPFLLNLVLLFFFSGCSREDKPIERSYPVQIGDTVQHDVPINIEVIGNVYSLQSIEIRPQVGGIILEAYVKQGQYVKKGDPLYKIDPRPYQASLEKAEALLLKDQASLKLAEITAERYKDLVTKDYISKLNFDQYQTNVTLFQGQTKIDKADVDMAKLNLEWTVPKSPIDGKISQFNIDVGNLVTVNDTTAFTNIRQLTPADIRFFITQKEFFAIQKSLQEGELKFEVLLPQRLSKPREGKIYFVDNHVNLATGTILMKGLIPNEDEFFWPGDFVRIRLQVKVEQNDILVSEQALKIGEEGYYVYVYNPINSTVEYRRVQKGTKFENMVVIEKGLKLGEKVVTKGQFNLRPGSKVHIVNNLSGIVEKNSEATKE